MITSLNSSPSFPGVVVLTLDLKKRGLKKYGLMILILMHKLFILLI